MQWMTCACGTDWCETPIFLAKPHCTECGRVGDEMKLATNVEPVQGTVVGKVQPALTVDLPPFDYPIPKTLIEVIETGGSYVGHSAVANWLECPERARLKALGVRAKADEQFDPTAELDSRGFGSLIHCLLAVRVIHGMGAAVRLLGPLSSADASDPWAYGLGVSLEDRLKAFHLLKTYDLEFPLDAEPFEYLGIEAEVITDVGGAHGSARAAPCVRSARYDAVVRFPNGDVYSLEHKTSDRGGEYAMRSYTPQFMVQCLIWNESPLAQKYGRMIGVIPDLLVKTKTPKCERLSPKFATPMTDQLARRYLQLPDSIRFPIQDDGTFPQFLHSCWNRYGACEYVSFCWEGSSGEYEIPEKGK